MKVLILDAYNANTLAIVRHLGKAGNEVSLVGNSKRNIAFYSKFVSGKFILPDPKKNEKEFSSELLNLIKNQKFDVLLPVGFKTFQICTLIKDEISQYVKILVPQKNAVEIASNKYKTYELAERLNVPYPKTIKINSVSQVSEIANVQYPLVIKSQIELGKTLVSYANNHEELIEKFNKMVSDNNFNEQTLPIIQEYVRGEGYGFFALYENGVCKDYFMHHRIREYPPSGGISTCAESFRDEKLMQYSIKLLDDLKWNGVAMVEFKRNEQGEYKLMEINPKFWGSLELSITAGVNFPKLIIELLSGQSRKVKSPPYKMIRFQWLFNGELFHFFEKPSSFFKITADFFRSKNDFWWSDIKPNLLQLVNIFYHLIKKLK